jgi:small subunit ribosomal protein S20
MANIKSALKRIKSSETKRLRNKYYHKTMRNAIRKYKALTEKIDSEKMFPSLASMIDKLAKKNVIHENKAGNLKSKLSKHLVVKA